MIPIKLKTLRSEIFVKIAIIQSKVIGQSMITNIKLVIQPDINIINIK